MLSLKKKSTAVALSAGLVLTLGACGDDDPVTGDITQEADPVAEIDNLTGVSTAVEADPSFLEALQSLNVMPGTVGDATLTGSTLTFPITGGEVTYYDPDSGRDPFVEGEIEHEGSGLSLTSGDTRVELTDFVVQPDDSVLTGTVSANGEVVEEEAELFFLDGSTLEPLQRNEAEGTAVLQGTTVSLTQEAADLLNDTFGTDALSEFFLVGTATITLALEDGAGASPQATTPATGASPEATTPGTGASPEASPTPVGGGIDVTVEPSPNATS